MVQSKKRYSEYRRRWRMFLRLALLSGIALDLSFPLLAKEPEVSLERYQEMKRLVTEWRPLINEQIFHGRHEPY